MTGIPLPSYDDGIVVIGPPDPAPGSWAGAPSALRVHDTYFLAYRLRRPEGEGRGYANVVARSSDGERFETLCEIRSDELGAESLERPALVRTPEGRWRLYVSCATPGTKHWRVDLLEADEPSGFRAATARTVLPGDELTGVKDPYLRHDGQRWDLWASVHPLDDPAATDRMTSEYATSADGVHWQWQGTALAGQPGEWDARGARITSVVATPEGGFAYYDGRADAAENFEERTGIAWSEDGGLSAFVSVEGGPHAVSPHPPGGLRYVSVVELGGDDWRLYYEATRADGAHELRTELVHTG